MIKMNAKDLPQNLSTRDRADSIGSTTRSRAQVFIARTESFFVVPKGN